MEVYLDEKGGVHHKPDDIRPTRRLSAYAIVQDDDGKYLMVQPTWRAMWEWPGGGVELEESIREGVVREFFEETGHTITVQDQPVFVSERNFFSKEHNVYYKAVLLFFRGNLAAPPAEDWKMNSVIENEISKIEWVDPATLTEQNTHPIFWPTIMHFRSTS